MSQEVLIPKMKRIDKKQKKINVSLLNFVFVIFSTILIIAATFLNLSFKHYILPQTLFSAKDLSMEDFIYCFSIIPQIPVLLFICSSFGKKVATTSVCMYILLGLFVFPLFALGGGIGYFSEYSFGYILAYLPAVLIAGTILKKKYSFLSMFLVSLIAVLLIHACGVVYMFLISLFKNSGLVFIKNWLSAQSGIKIFYDIIMSFVLVLIGKYINNFIKFITE